jgi:hypothetical protein
MNDDIIDELARFNDEFAPETGRLLGLESLQDGDYDFQITEAELTRTLKTRDLILRLTLSVHGGPADGRAVEHVYFLTKQEKVNRLGGDLLLLGFDADKWTPQHGRNFAAEVGRTVASLRGLCFRGHKSSNQDGNGKVWHNLNISARLADRPMPSMSPEDLPF